MRARKRRFCGGSRDTTTFIGAEIGPTAVIRGKFSAGILAIAKDAIVAGEIEVLAGANSTQSANLDIEGRGRFDSANSGASAPQI